MIPTSGPSFETRLAGAPQDEVGALDPVLYLILRSGLLGRVSKDGPANEAPPTNTVTSLLK